MSINYRPIGNRLVVKPIEITQEERIVNGIEQVDAAIIFQRGEVLAVGIGEYASQTGLLMPMQVKKRDVVLFRREGAFLPVRIDNVNCRLMREGDIEAIIE